jgi:hypothetical protein
MKLALLSVFLALPLQAQVICNKVGTNWSCLFPVEVRTDTVLRVDTVRVTIHDTQTDYYRFDHIRISKR